MRTIEEIYNILLSRGYAEELFSELGKSRKDGKANMKTLCPNCGGDDFSYSLVKPVYHCFNCNIGGDWLDYLQEYKSMDFKEGLAYLADQAGVKLDDLSESAMKTYTEKKDKAALLEEAQKLFIETLWAPEGKEVLNYLLDRGYKEAEIKSMQLGAYTDRNKLISHLKDKGYSTDQVKKSGLFTGGRGKGFGLTHILTIMWRDRAGRASGLVCRAIENTNLPKYLYSKGMKRSEGFIGFDKVRGEKTLIVVEGILDSLYLNTFAQPAIAVGGTSISDSQLKALEDARTEELLLALDNDKSGQEATESIIKQLQGTKLRPYVIDLPEGMDPDQFIRDNDIKAFRDRLKRAVRGSKWLAKYITSRHDLQTDRGRDKAVSEAMDIWEMLEKGQRNNFSKALADSLPISGEELKERVDKRREELTQEKAKNAIQKTIREVNKLGKQGDIARAQQTLEAGLDNLKQARGISAPEPYRAEDFLEDVTETQEGLKTGYRGLDRNLRISNGALTFIAGRPGHGKTTFMLNILLNMIDKYSDKHFYFFSYEENRERLTRKILMNLAEVVLNEQTNFNAYLNYFQEKRGSNDRIERALNKFETYTGEGRLYLVAEAMKADKLASTIHYMANKDDKLGAVFIDYIQKVQPPESLNVRYREIADITETLRKTAQDLDIPVIAGAQLSRNTSGLPKMRHLRESGDIEQDANLILGLVDGERDSEVKEKHDEYLQINIIKNREGPVPVDKVIPHNWEKKSFKIKDIKRG